MSRGKWIAAYALLALAAVGVFFHEKIGAAWADFRARSAETADSSDSPAESANESPAPAESAHTGVGRLGEMERASELSRSAGAGSARSSGTAAGSRARGLAERASSRDE